MEGVSAKTETSPLPELAAAAAAATTARGHLDMWDLRLAQERRSAVTPTVAGSPSLPPAGAGSTGAAALARGGGGGGNLFNPLRAGAANPAEAPTTHLELLAMALRGSPAVMKQVKFDIAKLVLARGGANVRPTEEEANLIVEMLARELAPLSTNSSSITPPDGRATIDKELQWCSTKDAPVLPETQVARPNAPVNDAPQTVQEPAVSSALLESTIGGGGGSGGGGGARRFGSESSNGANPIRPKPQVIQHANKTTLQRIKRHGGLGPRGHSAFSERSDGSYGSHTGSSVSKDCRAE